MFLAGAPHHHKVGAELLHLSEKLTMVGPGMQLRWTRVRARLNHTQSKSSGHLVQGSSGAQQHVAVVCKRFLGVKLAGDVQGAARRLPEECAQPGVSHNFSANVFVAKAKFFMRAFH